MAQAPTPHSDADSVLIHSLGWLASNYDADRETHEMVAKVVREALPHCSRGVRMVADVADAAVELIDAPNPTSVLRARRVLERLHMLKLGAATEAMRAARRISR